jgi:N4-gp56 family major capsid protein
MAVAPPKTTLSVEENKNIDQYWDRDLLEYAKPALIHTMFGNDQGVPTGYDAQNPGVVDAIRWMRPRRIPVQVLYSATAAIRPEALYTAATLAQHQANQGGYQLTQGADPTSSDGQPVARDIGIDVIQATPQEYGAYYIGAARMLRAGVHSYREMVTEILGRNAGEVFDLICRNQLVGQFTIQYASTATSVDTVAPGMLFAFKELVEAVAALKDDSATPVKNEHFVAIISPQTWASMMLDETFQRTVIFGNKNTMFDGVVNKGRVPWVGVEFYETPFAMRQTGALAEVHSTFIFAKDAYGVVDLNGLPMRNIFHDVGSAGTADPMNQRWTQSWKGSTVAKVLNPDWGIELRHAVAL